jgi:hypothetical protein
MSSGNDTQRPGEQPAADPAGGCVDDPSDSRASGSIDDEDPTADPVPPASPDPSREGRRKAGVRYRPV